MNQTNEQADNSGKKSNPRKVFKDFAEYWHLVRPLSESQQRIIADSLSPKEQKALKSSYERGGWRDLFRRNINDFKLDLIKQHFQVDLLELRTKILSGKPQLVQKSFWRYCNSLFNDDGSQWEDIAYIFDGIVPQEFDETYLKLSKYK